MKKIAVVIVALIVLAAYAVGQSGRPVTVTCSQVSGGPMATARGVDVAQRIGDGIHRLIKGGENLANAKDIQRAEQQMLDTLIRLWWRTLAHSANGQKLDPQAIKVQRQARQLQVQAEQSCTPCPDGPGTTGGPDPAQLVSQSANLTRAALAQSAAVAAGFPAAEIPMAVAVANKESGFNSRAVNPAAFTRGTVRGEWQIYYGVHPELDMSHAFDVYANARDALSVWKAAGGSWSPWTTAAAARASLGSQQLPEVRTAALASGGNVSGTPSGAAKACVTVGGDMSTPNPDGTYTLIDTPAAWGQLGNPHTPAQALAYMARMDASNTPVHPNWCLAYVAIAYGWTSGSGEKTAIAEWNAIPTSMKHPGNTIRQAPAGALVFWKTGNPARHIAIADGKGGVYTTDAPTRGQIGHVSIATLDGWGPEIGFSEPFFPAVAKERV